MPLSVPAGPPGRTVLLSSHFGLSFLLASPQPPTTIAAIAPQETGFGVR